MIEGRVLSVNVSAGGVPKRSVGHARVGRFGLAGDKHREDTVHGGPFRAVCLFGIEAIERLQAEGHPVEPGGVGENLTTSGVDWSTLPEGTRIRVGDHVELELALPAMPCDTQRPNFIRGEFKRISVALFPTDSRMYARVVTEGEVREGDRIWIEPAAGDRDPQFWRRLNRIDDAELEADVRLWAAAANGGLDIHVAVDGELAMACAPDDPEPAFNHALGLRMLPNLVPRVLDFYRQHGTTGQFGMDQEPWPGADEELVVAVMGEDAQALDLDAHGESLPDGMTLRKLAPGETDVLAQVVLPVFEPIGFDGRVWRALLPHLLATRNVHVWVVEAAGKPVACGLLSIHRKIGQLRTGLVLPEARGRGLQRALIRERARFAIADGCEVIAAHCAAGSLSERNLVACGLRRLGTRRIFAFDPSADPAPAVTEHAVVVSDGRDLAGTARNRPL